MFGKIALALASVGLGLAPVSNAFVSPVQNAGVSTSFAVRGLINENWAGSSSSFSLVSSAISGDPSTPWYSVSHYSVSVGSPIFSVNVHDTNPAYSRVCLDHMVLFDVYIFQKWSSAGGGVYALPLIGVMGSFSLGNVAFSCSSFLVTDTASINGVRYSLFSLAGSSLTFNSSLTTSTLPSSQGSSVSLLPPHLYFLTSGSLNPYMLGSISNPSTSSIAGDFISRVLGSFLYGLQFSLTCTAVATPVEVIDIYTLMAMIITMPFTFFQQAFDVELFANTPYAFNVSTIIYSVFVIVILWAIIKLLLGFGK